MKRFDELTIEQFKVVLEKSEDLRRMLDAYIQDCECEYLCDMLRSFNFGIADWNIGFYNNNYFCAKDCLANDDYEYISCIEDSVTNFGCSERLERLIEQCKKLIGSNLYMYYIKKLYRLYFEEELEPIIKYVEGISYQLYCGNVDETLDYIEGFQERYSDFLYDEVSGTYYKPCKIAN